MIRPIDIKINAAHPELPLAEASAYTGAPSTVLIRGVPGSCGKWAITAVQVCATFPDNATVCREAVQSANGVWVATLPGSSTSGRTRSGLWITASGVDENGAAVTGYILGVADFAIYALGTAPAPAPGGTSYAMHYFESLPTAANEGDVALDGDVWKIYNGDEWVALGGVTLDDAVTRTSANGVKSSGIWAAIWGALTALPTGFSSLYDWVVAQLSGKASTADATLTPIFDSPEGATWSIAYPQGWTYGTVYVDPWDNFLWKMNFTSSGETFGASDDINATSFSGTYEGLTVVATRTDAPVGYRLGSQTNKPLASEAEAEALRAGKLDKAAVIAPSTESSASGKAADAKATGDALAALPTKSQLDAGWWSDWTILRNGADVTSQVRQPVYDGGSSNLWTVQCLDGEYYDGYTYGAGNATSLVWESETIATGDANTYTASRHRVAAPVPTKPEDIGAANRASPATAGNLAALDAQGNPTDSGKTPADFMAADAKIQRIYNAAGTDALDDKGQLFMPGWSGNYYVYNGTTYEYIGFLYYGGWYNNYFYTYANGSNALVFRPNIGDLRQATVSDGVLTSIGSKIFEDSNLRDRNPLNGDDLNPTTPVSGLTFYKREQAPASVKYARLALEAMPLAWTANTTYKVGVCASNGGVAYRCKTEHTSGSTFDASKWDEIPVLSQKANAADLPYSFNAATVSSGTTPTVTGLANRAINTATLGSTVTAATVTLPAATADRARDFFIDLTIETTDAPTLTFIDPATSTTANVAFGADSLADIAPGYNLVLWTELPNNRWLVSVRHEEAT